VQVRETHERTIGGIWDVAESRHDQFQVREDVRKQEQIADSAGQQRKVETIVGEAKVGRNAPCPCGSGKKHKHCCGRRAR